MACQGNVTFTTDLTLRSNLAWSRPDDVRVYNNGTWTPAEVYVWKRGQWIRAFPPSSETLPEINHPEWVFAAVDISGYAKPWLVNIADNTWVEAYDAPVDFGVGKEGMAVMSWHQETSFIVTQDPENLSGIPVNSFAMAGATLAGGLPVGGRLLIYTQTSVDDPDSNLVCTKQPTLMHDISLGPTKFETLRPVYSNTDNIANYDAANAKCGFIVAGYGGTAWLFDNMYSKDWDQIEISPGVYVPTGIKTWCPPGTYSHYNITTNFHHINDAITNGTDTLNRIKYATQTGYDSLGLGVYVCEDGYILDGSLEAANPYGNYFPYQGFPNLTIEQQQTANPWPATGTAPYGMLGSPITAKGVQGADCSMLNTGLGPYGNKWMRELKICDTALNSITMFKTDMAATTMTIVDKVWAYQGTGYGNPSLPLVLRRRNVHLPVDMIAVGDNGKILLRTAGSVYSFTSPGLGSITLAGAGNLYIDDQSPNTTHVGFHSYGDMFKNPWYQYTGYLEDDGNGNTIFREWTETADLRHVYSGINITIIVGDGGVIYYSPGPGFNMINGEGGQACRFFRAIAVTVANLNYVTWKGDRYIATGDMGTVLESPDGITWSNVTQSAKPTSFKWGPGKPWDPGFQRL